MSTILIVDDVPSAQETIIAMLEWEGYQLEVANNGPEALKMAERLEPDLILLDVMMPRMDGFEVCRRLRSTPQLAEVPIIMLTALNDLASRVTGIKAGADDFLSKPIRRQELIARARTITRLNRYRTLLEQRENLREMAERVVIAQEEERKRLSRELHDNLGQALTIHLMAIRALQEEINPEEPLFEKLEAFNKQSQEIFASIHQIAKNMRPPALDTLGLKLALENHCTEFTRHTHLPVAFEAEQELPPLPDIYEIILYRTLQEALTNIFKHARASQVWVELSLEEDLLSLVIQDNGRGIENAGRGIENAGRGIEDTGHGIEDTGHGIEDTGHGIEDAELKIEDILQQSNGIGLTGLHERLTLVGGRLIISSGPKRGTILSAQLPLTNNHPGDKNDTSANS